MLSPVTARRPRPHVRTVAAVEASVPRTYRAVMAVVWPFLRGWGRLRVDGVENLPATGPVLLVGNHDSAWDPFVIAAALRRRRQIRALARSDLWTYPVLGRVLDAMGQIPVDRGRGDVHAMDRAVAQLAAGACVGVFPEGTVSRGRTLRARSGAGRLAVAVPEARVVGVAVTGTPDIARFPRRPRLRVQVFVPTDPAPRPGESATVFAARILAETRLRAPVPGPRDAGRQAG